MHRENICYSREQAIDKFQTCTRAPHTMSEDYVEKAYMRLDERNEVHLQEFYLRNNKGSRWCLAPKPSEAKLTHHDLIQWAGKKEWLDQVKFILNYTEDGVQACKNVHVSAAHVLLLAKTLASLSHEEDGRGCFASNFCLSGLMTKRRNMEYRRAHKPVPTSFIRKRIVTRAKNVLLTLGLIFEETPSRRLNGVELAFLDEVGDSFDGEYMPGTFCLISAARSFVEPCRGDEFEQQLAAIPHLPARPKAPGKDYRVRLEEATPECRMSSEGPKLFPDDIEEFKQAHADWYDERRNYIYKRVETPYLLRKKAGKQLLDMIARRGGIFIDVDARVQVDGYGECTVGELIRGTFDGKYGARGEVVKPSTYGVCDWPEELIQAVMTQVRASQLAEKEQLFTVQGKVAARLQELCPGIEGEGTLMWQLAVGYGQKKVVRKRRNHVVDVLRRYAPHMQQDDPTIKEFVALMGGRVTGRRNMQGYVWGDVWTVAARREAWECNKFGRWMYEENGAPEHVAGAYVCRRYGHLQKPILWGGISRVFSYVESLKGRLARLADKAEEKHTRGVLNGYRAALGISLVAA